MIRPVVAAALLACFTAGGTSAQCDRCEIVIERTATLGDDERGPIGPIATLATFADGRIAFSYDAADAEIMIFERDGRFVQRVGRRGQGPGEFTSIRFLRTAGDGFAAIDGAQRRITVFGPELDVRWTVPTQLYVLGDVLALADSVIVLNGVDPRPDAVGPLLHVVTPSGVSARFGADPEGFRFDQEFGMGRRLARSPGGFWVARTTRYLIEEYTPSGERRRVVEREVDWFRPHLTAPTPPGPDGPTPFIVDVQEEGGLLWVLVAVADRDWSRAAAQTIEGPALGVGNRNGFFDTVIEVLDPGSGRVVASTRVDQLFEGFHAAGAVSSYEEVGGIQPRITLWSLGLRERPTQP